MNCRRTIPPRFFKLASGMKHLDFFVTSGWDLHSIQSHIQRLSLHIQMGKIKILQKPWAISSRRTLNVRFLLFRCSFQRAFSGMSLTTAVLTDNCFCVSTYSHTHLFGKGLTMTYIRNFHTWWSTRLSTCPILFFILLERKNCLFLHTITASK